MNVAIALENERLAVTVPFHLKDTAKRAGGSWAGEGPVWYWPASPDVLQRLLRTFPGAWCDGTVGKLKAWADRQEELRSAADGPQPPAIAVTLRPYQRVAVAFLNELDRALLHDDIRLGKTYEAISWAVSRASRPLKGHGTLVVCPQTAKWQYRNEIKACLPNAKVAVVEGRKGPFPASHEADFVVLNYDLLSCTDQGEERGISTRLKQIIEFGFRSVIFSEAHRAKAGAKSLRGQAVEEISRAVPCVLPETASPMPNGRPIELFPLLCAIGLYSPRQRHAFGLEFCNAFKKKVWVRGKPRDIWDYSGSSNLDRLKAIIRPYCIGRKWPDVLDQLPVVQHTAPLVPLCNQPEYDALERELLDLIARAKAAKAKGLVGDFLQLRAEASGMHKRLEVVAARGKVQAAVEMLESYQYAKRKVLVLCEYLDPLREIHALYPGCSELLIGDVKGEERQAVIDRFQGDPKQLFLLSTRATGGVALTLSAADTAIMMTLPWVPEDWRQAWGRMLLPTQKHKSHVTTLLSRFDAGVIEANYSKALNIEALFGAAGAERIRQESERFKDMAEVLEGPRLTAAETVNKMERTGEAEGPEAKRSLRGLY